MQSELLQYPILCLNRILSTNATDQTEHSDKREGKAGGKHLLFTGGRGGMVPRFLSKSGREPSSKLEIREMHQKVHEAIESLPPDQKSAVVLVSLQGMKHSDAASVLECAESTVSWRIYEAKKTMAVKLKHLLE